VTRTRRLKGYSAAVAASSCVFTGAVFLLMIGSSFYAETHSAPGMYADSSIVFELTPVVLVGTILATAVWMFVPWILVLGISCQMRWSGPRFFMASGSGCGLLVGCIASFLMPKALFIEDQTFLQALIIFAERLGPMVFVSGLVGGWTYWSVAERSSAVGWAALQHTNRHAPADKRDTCD